MFSLNFYSDLYSNAFYLDKNGLIGGDSEVMFFTNLLKHNAPLYLTSDFFIKEGKVSKIEKRNRIISLEMYPFNFNFPLAIEKPEPKLKKVIAEKLKGNSESMEYFLRNVLDKETKQLKALESIENFSTIQVDDKTLFLSTYATQKLLEIKSDIEKIGLDIVREALYYKIHDDKGGATVLLYIELTKGYFVLVSFLAKAQGGLF